ncbi:PAS domain S-box protein [Methylobacterium sp. BTF04]|uniref:PAS domain S-box protein n=1 Tax=Methylobacterium sp. BTF04 TaxID=2708300 RepID=UPI0013D5CB8F|nr:PAS domain S-box protein [Methylobacterium sp. BTF04]NEU10940.1 PAS domain S-box protein [Methylobacterium sp. BTF04]
MLRGRRRGFQLSAAAIGTLAAVAMILGIGAWQIHRSRKLELADASGQALSLTRTLAQHAARTLEGVDLILSGLISRLDEDANQVGVSALTGPGAATLAQIRHLTVLGADGRMRFDSLGRTEANEAAKDAVHWHRERPDLDLHVGPAFESRGDGMWVIPVSRRIDRRDGSFDGVVVATLRADYFRGFYRDLRVGGDGAITLWLDTGRILVREPALPQLVGADLSRSRMFTTDLPARNSGVFRVSAALVDGRARIVAFERLDRYPLIVTASLTLDDALAAWRRETLIQSLLMGLSVCALIGLGITLERRQRRIAVSERASREAQLLFRGLFENATDLQFVFRVDRPAAFRLETWNPSAAAAMQLSPESPAGLSLEELRESGQLSDAQVDRVRADMERAVATGEPVRTEDRTPLAAGIRHWEAIYVPLRDSGSDAVTRVFLGVRDITHLKTAEAEAREANRFLIMAEQVAHIGHWHVDLPSRRLTWSDEVYRIHGLDPETFTPTVESGVAAYHPDDRARVATCVARAIERQEGFDFALRLVRPSGEIRDVLVRGICQFNRDAQGHTEDVRSIFGVFADVTDLKQAERALAENSALLKATLDSMDQGLLLIDGNGKVPIANQRAMEILSLSPEFMANTPDYRSVRRYLRETGAWGLSIQNPEHWHLDKERRTTDVRSERRRADGSVIEFRSLPMHRHDGYIQTLTDITERRRAEERLRDSEARYRLLADYTSDLIVLDDANGRHLYISPAVTSMLGYTLAEANAVGLRTLVHAEDIANLSAILHALEPDRPTGSVIYRLRHRAGHDIWVEAAFRRIEEQGGVQIIQAIRDVTERQSQEADLQRARGAAEAGAQVKAEFLANMSHELRTPLAGILGVHDLLRSDPTLSVSQDHLVALAQESGRSLLTIVNDILDFSKIEAGQLVIEAMPFGLRALMEGCRVLSAETIGAGGVALSVAVEPDVPDWLIGDPTRLRQVILNLATNAIKFTPEGSVMLRALWHAEAGRCGSLRIEVVDTGIGIAAETLPHLFERFAQADGSTSRKYGGTGLGLTICKRLVRLMGGEIGVESRLREGSTFWFTLSLPLARPQSVDGARMRGLLAAPAGRKQRLLLAEDNPINQEIIGTVLRQKGHSVIVVGDGERAVAAVTTEAAFDLVLMDVQMPGQDGLEATRAIREWERAEGRPRVPIVALTANAMTEEVERCRAAGMDAHVAKPVDWSVLFATMERLVNANASDDDAAVEAAHV